MTIQQHASFDSSAAELNATSKLVKAWESKNAKNAAKAGGISLMALSLAACGGSSTTTTTATSTDSTTTDSTTTVVAPVVSALTIANDNVDGTAGNDTVSGARIDTVQTFNSGDTIDLGAGTDSFSATVSASVTPASLTGVENVTFTALNTATIDFDNASGVTSITSLGSSGALTVDDIQALATSVSVANNSATQTFVFKDAALAGASDSLILNLDGAGGIVNVGGETDADGDIETLVINATGGASDLAAGNGFGADATSITVNATVALDLGSTAQFAKATTFDASASSGGVTAVFADRAAASETAVAWTGGSAADNFDVSAMTIANFGDVTVSMGAGADTLTVGAVQDTDTGSSYDGGAGEDILHVASSPMTAAFAANVTNFEVLEFLVSGTDSQDMDLTAGMNIVSIKDAAAATADLNLTDAASGLEVRLTHADLAGVATNADDFDILNVDLKTDTASDTLTVKIGGTGGNMQLGNFEPDARYETVTVVSTGSSANTIASIDTAVNNMTFSGAGALTITSTNALTGVADFSAMTGVATVTTGTAAMSVIGGAGDDVVVSGVVATATQVISGGAGDDSITAGVITTAGVLTITGDAGSDTITVAAMTGAITASSATINGGTGVDFITLDANAGNVVDVISTATTVADADEITGFTSGTAATDDDFDYNGTVLNDGVSTIVAVSDTTLAAGLSTDPNATVYIVTTALTGAAATDMTALVAESTAAGVLTDYATFEASFVTNLGTVAGLDSTLSATESVLINVDDGTNSVVLRVTNTDTSTANTLTVDEIDLVAVMVAADDLVTADFI